MLADPIRITYLIVTISFLGMLANFILLVILYVFFTRTKTGRRIITEIVKKDIKEFGKIFIEEAKKKGKKRKSK